MSRTDEPDWSRRLAPLVLGEEPLDDQFRRRRGATLVAGGLLGGMMLFLMTVFAGFGRADLGRIFGLSFLVVIGSIVRTYYRLRGALTEYRSAHPEAFEPPPGRPSSA